MIIEKGNLVTMEYGGRFESGEIFDSSMKGGVLKPLVFNVGRMEIIKGLDEGVLGMEEGEEKEIVILPEKGYGEYNIELKNIRPRRDVFLRKLRQGLFYNAGNILCHHFPFFGIMA